MSEEQTKQYENTNFYGSDLKLPPLDLAYSIPELVCKLGKKLGCKQPNWEHCMLNTHLAKYTHIKFYDFWKRLKQQQDTGQPDEEEKKVQQLRYKLFLHFYRLQTKLQPEESVQQQYLIVLHELFDAKKPKEMQLEEVLRYREAFIDRLIVLTKNIIHLNSSILDNAIQYIVKVELARVEHKFATFHPVLRGFRLEREIYQITIAQKLEQVSRIIDMKTVQKGVLINWKSREKHTASRLDLILDGTYKMQSQTNSTLERRCEEILNGMVEEAFNVELAGNTTKQSSSSIITEDDGDKIETRESLEMCISKLRTSCTTIRELPVETFNSHITRVSPIPITILEETVNIEFTKAEQLHTSIFETDLNGITAANSIGDGLFTASSTEAEFTGKTCLNLEGCQSDKNSGSDKALQTENVIIQSEQATITEIFPSVKQCQEVIATEKELITERDTPEIDQWIKVRSENDTLKFENLPPQIDLPIIKTELEIDKITPKIDQLITLPELKAELPTPKLIHKEFDIHLKETRCESSLPENDQPKPICPTVLPRVLVKLSSGRPATPKWQHQRHIIAAPRFIIRLFKCNPGYQCSPMDPNAPNFYEQLIQFYEIMASSCSISAINVTGIKQRIETIIKEIMWQSSYKANLCLPEIAKIQLMQLFTTAELREYETLRWRHQERGKRFNLSEESRLQDALHAMLGYECLQLRYSALRNTLMLRWPHYQSTISESFLLLSLGQVGYYYKQLQLQEQRLRQLGEIGRELSICLLSELHFYFQFCIWQREEQNQSLLHLFRRTRVILHRFCWLLQLCIGLSCRQSLLNCLQLQLKMGNEEYNELLESWLLAATQPLLARISNWLVSGELPDEEFFIVVHKDSNPTHYWQSHFKLVEEQLPPFLNSQLAQQLLNAGKCQDYAKQFLGLRLNVTLQAEELQQQLSQSCVQCYQELEQHEVEQLIGQLERKTAQELFIQLHQWVPTPLELLSKLHQYLLLTDVQFVGQLIELLEPALEQPYDYYDVRQLNNMLELVFNGCIEPLYVAESFYPGHHCWQRFLLRWQQQPHWLPLIGHSLAQYESCFVCIWQLHYANYVLNERIGRQQLHIHERINLDDSTDARSVRDRFRTFIEQLQDFMHKLRGYVLDDVLDSAFQSLSLGCATAQTLDDLLQIHGAYLNSIACGILQGKQCLKSRQYLSALYEIIMQLDAVQQKFIALGQPFNQSIQNLESLQDLRLYCQHTCDSIDDLEEQFEHGLSNFLLTLYYSREPQLEALARRLDHRGYYEQKYTQLQQVQTFRFQRKIIADP